LKTKDVWIVLCVFATRDDVSNWARVVAYEIGFVTVIMRLDTNIVMKGRTSFVLIGYERSDQYRVKKKDLVRTDSGCPFKRHKKPVIGGQGWMVKLMYGNQNHEMKKSLVGHSYDGRLIMDEKIIVVDMTKSMMKPINILLMMEYIANSYTTIKQIYNARSAYHSFIRGSDTEMQQLMKLLERDQYIH